jgi:ketosteroid isomerase-like protein
MHSPSSPSPPAHPHARLLATLYTALDAKDHAAMAACYHPDAEFRDIAFTLRGRTQIHAMWHLIAETDLRATFTVRSADDETGTVDLVDDYTFRDTGRRVRNVIRSEFRFRDGLIVAHRDACSAARWGVQALGPVKGVLAWLVPATRRAKAMAKLRRFIASHPEYA